MVWFWASKGIVLEGRVVIGGKIVALSWVSKEAVFVVIVCFGNSVIEIDVLTVGVEGVTYVVWFWFWISVPKENISLGSSVVIGVWFWVSKVFVFTGFTIVGWIIGGKTVVLESKEGKFVIFTWLT